MNDHTKPSAVMIALQFSKKKARYKFHIGSDMEIRYELRRFGIDLSGPMFPIDMKGEITLDNHREWIQNQRPAVLTESSPSELSSIGSPSSLGSLGNALVSRKGYTEPRYSRNDNWWRDRGPDASLPKETATVDLPCKTERSSPAATGGAGHQKPPPAAVALSATGHAIIPTNNDVLFGRGMYTQKHPGT